jgi:hypothetical protein
MPLTATKQWNVEVGRIRENDIFGEYGLDLFVCGDQVPYILVTRFLNPINNMYARMYVLVAARSRFKCCAYS